MAGNPAIKYVELFETMAAVLAASLVERGIAETTARAGAEEAVESVRRDFGGQYIYVPKGDGYKRAHRNAQIRRRLAAGEDRVAIVREFGISEMQLRRITADDTPSRAPVTRRTRRPSPDLPPGLPTPRRRGS